MLDTVELKDGGCQSIQLEYNVLFEPPLHRPEENTLYMKESTLSFLRFSAIQCHYQLIRTFFEEQIVDKGQIFDFCILFVNNVKIFNRFQIHMHILLYIYNNQINHVLCQIFKIPSLFQNQIFQFVSLQDISSFPDRLFAPSCFLDQTD